MKSTGWAKVPDRLDLLLGILVKHSAQLRMDRALAAIHHDDGIGLFAGLVEHDLVVAANE
jgi:hypothetical protein